MLGWRIHGVGQRVAPSACRIVEAEVYPQGAPSATPVRPGPYTFADARQATAFVTEAVEALMYLGCDVQAQ